jgi:hypothetical protein
VKQDSVSPSPASPSPRIIQLREPIRFRGILYRWYRRSRLWMAMAAYLRQPDLLTWWDLRRAYRRNRQTQHPCSSIQRPPPRA